MRLQSGRSACSNWISECLLSHLTDTRCLNRVSWRTRWGLDGHRVWQCPAAHLKIRMPPLIIKWAKDDMLPMVTALYTVQTSRCTVKPTVTAAQNIVIFTSEVLTGEIRSDHLQMTMRTVKNQISETKWICLQFQQGLLLRADKLIVGGCD